MEELDGVGLIEAVAKRRGFRAKGGDPDLEQAALTLLKDYRTGALGRISLETPESRRAMLDELKRVAGAGMTCTWRFSRLLPGLFLLSSSAMAADPFNTDALVPPRPAMRVTAEEGGAPCSAPQSAAPLALLEVVEQALCNNPQTREVWANARVQAAQVGVAQAAYLPGVSAAFAASRNWLETAARSSPYDQNRAGLTLWPICFTILVRARQRWKMPASCWLLLRLPRTARCSRFFSLRCSLSTWCRRRRTALDAVKESERASRESFNAADARYQAGAATPADKLQAQTAWSQTTLNRITVEGSLKNAQGALANVIGQDANRPVALAPAVWVEPGESFRARCECPGGRGASPPPRPAGRRGSGARRCGQSRCGTRR